MKRICFLFTLLVLTKLDFKAKSKTNSIVAIDIRYASCKYFVEFRDEINANHLFIFNYFVANAKYGIAPFTNLGIIQKTAFNLGSTTLSNRLFSWNIMMGSIFEQTSRSQCYNSQLKETYDLSITIRPFNYLTEYYYRCTNKKCTWDLMSNLTGFFVNTYYEDVTTGKKIERC